MAETSTPKYLEDITRYQYGNVTARLAADKATAPFAKGSLEKLIDSFGLDKDIISGLKAGTLASQQGVNTAIEIYNKKYEDSLSQANVMDFYGLRVPVIKGLLGDEEAEKAKSVFEKYSTETIGSIRKNYNQAQAKINDDTGLFDKKQKEDAQKVIEKYAGIYSIVELLEQRNFDELKNGATKSTYKELLSNALKQAAD